jgi:hypothetical protein
MINSMFRQPRSAGFSLDAALMDSRLRARLSRGELFALALALGAIGLSIWVYRSLGYSPFDYNVYMLTAEHDQLQYYYAPWLTPLFWLWAKFPYWWGYALWGAVNIAGLFFAARVFGGSAALTLLSFQFFYCLFLGQINGLLLGMLALSGWALAHRRWDLAGLGFFIAGAKFQTCIPLGLLIWLAADIRGRDRLRALAVPAGLTLLSLLVWPSWPADLLERIRTYPPYNWGSISLWQYAGAAALLLLLPPLLFPLEKNRRFLALAAAIPLALPYFQQADLPVLFVLPVGWVPVLLGELGILFFKYQFAVLRLLWIVPLSVYLVILLPVGYVWLRKLAQSVKNNPGKSTSI